jgi:mxaA protein
MRWAAFGLMLFAGTLTAADAQVRSVKLVTPERLFGYFVGDVLRSEVDVTVDKGAVLNRASVPAPGDLGYWLELIDSHVEETVGSDTKLYRIFLVYQNFYPALDSRPMQIPGLALSFTSSHGTTSVEVPAWSFLISPLREVEPEAKASGVDYMQPDVTPPYYNLLHERIATFGLSAAALIAFGILAYHLALWPFGARAKRPFTEAARRIRKMLGARQDELAYRDALLALHRAVDATAGHVVFAEDLPEFLDRAPAFSRWKEEFNLFFQSSRQTFFANNIAAATADLSPDGLCQFSDRLAAAERAAP